MEFKYPAARRDESKVSAKVLLSAFSLCLVCRSVVTAHEQEKRDQEEKGKSYERRVRKANGAWPKKQKQNF